ncbi:MAG TPA: CoA pyrophosphatase [Ideonella sp.]|nr:CoA pyrophosphatase [Ideonella sp.]
MSSTVPSRSPIRDPQAVPLVGVDSHLPAIPAGHLTPQALRERLLDAHQRTPMVAGDGAGRGDLFADREPAAAAVLVPLVLRPDALHVLLTRRSDHLRDHAGQISFPGGRSEPEDADAVATALREAREEVGLDAAEVEVIGRLPVYTTVTRFIVTPVVALVQPDYRLTLDASEVAEAFEVPLPFLMDPANHHRHHFEMAGQSRQFLAMPWRRGAAESAAAPYFIWGATAAMLRNLYHLLDDSDAAKRG